MQVRCAIRTLTSRATLNPPSSPFAGAWPLLLVIAVLVLLPIGRSAELPLVVGAVAGVVLLLRRRLDVDDAGMRLACALFAC